MDSHGGLDGLSFGGGGSSGSNPDFKVILYKFRSELFDICSSFEPAGQCSNPYSLYENSWQT